MNPEGKKQNRDGDKDAALFANLARINAILDFEQQKQFNQWVQSLAENNEVQTIASLHGSIYPFKVSTTWTRHQKINQVRQQYVALKTDDGSRYV